MGPVHGQILIPDGRHRRHAAIQNRSQARSWTRSTGFSVLNLKVGLLLEHSSFLLDGFSAFLESLPHN